MGENLVAESIVKQFPTRGAPLIVLDEVTLSVTPDEPVAIMGPSGSGKSTLLNILGTLEPPTAGRLTIADADPFALSERDLARFRNRHIGFIFQEHHLLPQCTLLENVLIPTLAFAGSDGATDRARELIERVGLADRMDHLPSELSGGERQRVAVARALINRPTVLLADEPTGNLDRRSADAVTELILELHRAEQAVLVVVTHSERLAECLPRRLRLADGKLEQR